MLQSLCNQAETLLAEQRAPATRLATTHYLQTVIIKTRSLYESPRSALFRAPSSSYVAVGILRRNINLILEPIHRVVEFKKSVTTATIIRVVYGAEPGTDDVQGPSPGVFCPDWRAAAAYPPPSLPFNLVHIISEHGHNEPGTVPVRRFFFFKHIFSIRHCNQLCAAGDCLFISTF